MAGRLNRDQFGDLIPPSEEVSEWGLEHQGYGYAFGMDVTGLRMRAEEGPRPQKWKRKVTPMGEIMRFRPKPQTPNGRH